jgi:diamine N-acetyltransferase
MISIKKATVNDYQPIINIGRVSVEEAHRGSCSAEDMQVFLNNNYSAEVITAELKDENNIYHIIYVDKVPAGFSKIVLNAAHPNIQQRNVTKLDRIYLLKEFVGLKLGYKLLSFNIELSKTNQQAGIWLFTWVNNVRAVNFYKRAGFTIAGSHNFKVTKTHYNLNHHMFLVYPPAEIK